MQHDPYPKLMKQITIIESMQEIAQDNWSNIIEYANHNVLWTLWNTSMTFRPMIARRFPDTIIALDKEYDNLHRSVVCFQEIPRSSAAFSVCVTEAEPSDSFHVLLEVDSKDTVRAYMGGNEIRVFDEMFWYNNDFRVVQEHHMPKFLKLLEESPQDNIVYDLNSMTILLNIDDTVRQNGKIYLAFLDSCYSTRDSDKVTCKLFGHEILLDKYKDRCKFIGEGMDIDPEEKYYYDRYSGILLNVSLSYYNGYNMVYLYFYKKTKCIHEEDYLENVFVLVR